MRRTLVLKRVWKVSGDGIYSLKWVLFLEMCQVFGFWKTMFQSQDHEHMLCLVLLNTMSSHLSCNHFVPPKQMLGEMVKGNNSCVLVLAVVKGLNKGILVKMWSFLHRPCIQPSELIKKLIQSASITEVSIARCDLPCVLQSSGNLLHCIISIRWS